MGNNDRVVGEGDFNDGVVPISARIRDSDFAMVAGSTSPSVYVKCNDAVLRTGPIHIAHIDGDSMTAGIERDSSAAKRFIQAVMARFANVGADRPAGIRAFRPPTYLQIRQDGREAFSGEYAADDTMTS